MGYFKHLCSSLLTQSSVIHVSFQTFRENLGMAILCTLILLMHDQWKLSSVIQLRQSSLPQRNQDIQTSKSVNQISSNFRNSISIVIWNVHEYIFILKCKTYSLDYFTKYPILDATDSLVKDVYFSNTLNIAQKQVKLSGQKQNMKYKKSNKVASEKPTSGILLFYQYVVLTKLLSIQSPFSFSSRQISAIYSPQNHYSETEIA